MKSNRTKKEEWCYISGLVYAQVDKLIAYKSYAELAAITNIDELINRLRQTLLFSRLEPQKDAVSLLIQMDELYKSEITEFVKYSPYPELINLFLLTYNWLDFRNFLKSTFCGTERHKPALSTLPENVLLRIKENLICEPEFIPYAKAFKAFLDLADSKDKTGAIEIICDIFEQKHMLKCAEYTNSSNIIQFYKKLLQIVILTGLLRAKLNNFDKSLLIKCFTKFPLDSEIDILEVLEFDTQDFQNIFNKIFDQNITFSFQSKESLKVIQDLTDKFIKARLEKFLKIPFGIEPVFAYLHFLLFESKNLKIIVAGKMSSLSENEILKEIRNIYG